MKVWLPYVRGASGGGNIYTARLAAGLRAAGVDVVVTSFSHVWQYFPWRLSVVAVPERTDIVLSNNWWAFPFRSIKAKLVVVEHHCVFDSGYTPYRSPAQAIYYHGLLHLFEKMSLQAADAVVTVSSYTSRSLVNAFSKFGAAPKVILNGIETDFFSPPEGGKRPRNGRPVRLLYIGNLTRRKGADLLPRIMAALGSGFELRYTSGLRGRDPLAGRSGMIPLGSLSSDEIRDAYREADLLLFPTRFEGFGYPAAEALACGTPVITSACSSMPEIVEDGITGRLCPVDDVEAFAAAVRELSGDPRRLAVMSQRARDAAVERFGLDRMVSSYIKLFEGLLGS